MNLLRATLQLFGNELKIGISYFPSLYTVTESRCAKQFLLFWDSPSATETLIIAVSIFQKLLRVFAIQVFYTWNWQIIHRYLINVWIVHIFVPKYCPTKWYFNHYGFSFIFYLISSWSETSRMSTPISTLMSSALISDSDPSKDWHAVTKGTSGKACWTCPMGWWMHPLLQTFFLTMLEILKPSLWTVILSPWSLTLLILILVLFPCSLSSNAKYSLIKVLLLTKYYLVELDVSTKTI